MAENRYLDKAAAGLFKDEETQRRFKACLLDGNCAAPAALWLKERPTGIPFEIEAPASFQPPFVDRLRTDSSAGKHRLHEDGAFYCLDLSSVFSASVLLKTLEFGLQKPLCLDMCSSPGGKAVFCYRALGPAVLVCNETIGKRAGALISNLKRCNVARSYVTSSDPSLFSRSFKGAFDVVIVDAPCSGQSLLARGEGESGCFHPSTVNMNSNRQKRIVANSIDALCKGGFLAYMTCTFSKQENEGVVEWVLKKFPEMQPLEVSHLSVFQSENAGFPCYRLFPHQGYGAGAFACILRKEQGPEKTSLSLENLRVLWKLEDSR